MKLVRLVVVATTVSTLVAGAATATTASAHPAPQPALAAVQHGRVAPLAAAALERARPRPPAVTGVAAYEDYRRVTVSWHDPSAGSFQRVVVRYRVGHRAPAGPRRGLAVPVSGTHASTAVLHRLSPHTAYAVGVWTVAAGRTSARKLVTFRTAGPPPGPPAADAVISGLVTDTSGAPLAGVMVLSGSYNRFGTSRDRTVTDERGQYTLQMPRGRGFVFFEGGRATGGDADATGYVGDAVSTVLTSGEHVTIDRALADGAVLSGRVVDAAGDPVGGAVVFPSYPDTYVDVDQSGNYSVVDYVLAGAPRTGPNGRFRLAGLPETALRVCAQHTLHSGQACTDQAVLTATGSSHDAGVITVPAGHIAAGSGAVVGTVVDSAGRPVRRADIFLIRRRGSSYGDARTDADGRYRIADLNPGVYQGCIGVPTKYRPHDPTGLLARCVRGVRVDAGHSTRLHVVLRAGAAASGVVRTPAGRPVPHAAVELRTRNGGLGVIADGLGRFDVSGLPSGQYRVCTGATRSSSTGSRFGYAGHCHGRVTLRAGRRLLGVGATVAPAGAIAGRITTSGAGQPGKWVFALGLTGQGASLDDSIGRIDSNGRFRITGLAPGRYLVCPSVDWADGVSRGDCRRQPATVKALHTSQYGTVSLAAGSVFVTVRDTSGRRVAAVDMTAVVPCHRQFECDHLSLFPAGTGELIGASLMTGTRGRVQLNGLAPGHYALCGFAYLAAVPGTTPPTGFADGCSGNSFDITVEAGQVLHYTLTLATAGAVTGTVTDANGDPLQGVFVHVTGSAATDTPHGGLGTPARKAAVTGPNGTFTVRSVAPGKQTVCFRAGRAHDDAGPVAVQDQCFGGQPGQQDGTPVTVTGGQVTSGVDIALEPQP